jgi:hypothetical protein
MKAHFATLFLSFLLVQPALGTERLGRDYIRLATTGGEHFPDLPLSFDHVTLVTVDDEGVDIANLKMSGILDKTGHVPLDGDNVCFELLNF